MKKRIIAYIQSQELRLSLIVRKLETDKKISPSVFIKFMSEFDYYQKNNTSIHLIKKAIIDHFDHDYISSIHILVPQIEVTLRAVLSSKGIIPLKIEKQGKEARIYENELGGLLENKDIKNYLVEDLTNLLLYKRLHHILVS